MTLFAEFRFLSLLPFIALIFIGPGYRAIRNKAYKAILFRIVNVALFAWACYVPDVQLDLANAYLERGVLTEFTPAKTSSTISFNDETLCSYLMMLGCRSKLHYSSELNAVIKNKKLVEVVFARDMGNSIGALFFNRTVVVEVRQSSKPLPYLSQEEMLIKYHRPWFLLPASAIFFLFVLPLFFNFDFYQKIIREYQ